MSKIEWTEQTWNPIVGCSKISEGCRNCYAINQSYRNEAIAKDRQAKRQNLGRLENYIGLTEKRGDRTEWTGAVRFVEDALDIPRNRKKPTVWFVNSMSDMFHENVSYTWFKDIVRVVGETPQHTYQILTKRPERMLEFVNRFHETEPNGFPANIWLGVTIENQKTANERIPLLERTPAMVRFLSCEPLLENIDFLVDEGFCCCDGGGRRGKPLCSCEGARFQESLLDWIDWVIVGGESGYGCRPCNKDWIESIVDQCLSANVPVFVKQLGGYPDKRHDFEQFPSSLQLRQMPKGVNINA